MVLSRSIWTDSYFYAIITADGEGACDSMDAVVHIEEVGKTMSQHVLIQLEMPADLIRFKLPKGVDRRLQSLLDR